MGQFPKLCSDLLKTGEFEYHSAKVLTLSLTRWGSEGAQPYARWLLNGRSQRQRITKESRIGRGSRVA